MRREYEDPEEYYQKYIDRAADRYANGLRRSGLKPNDRLTRAMAERTAREAQASYIRDMTEVRDHNIQMILRDHKKRLRQIKREGASLRLKTCPPITALFGFMAWYSFHQPGGFVNGLIYVVASFTFLAMLILGAIFDR